MEFWVENTARATKEVGANALPLVDSSPLEERAQCSQLVVLRRAQDHYRINKKLRLKSETAIVITFKKGKINGKKKMFKKSLRKIFSTKV